MTDDDVWAALTAGQHPPLVHGVWVDDRDRSALSNWLRVVDKRTRHVAILHAKRSERLPVVLQAVCEHLGGDRAPTVRRRTHVRTRWAAFDTKYEDALRLGSAAAIQAVTQEFRSDYLAVVDHLLCQSSKGLAPRWFPSLDGRSVSKPTLAADVEAVLLAAQRIVIDHVEIHSDGDSTHLSCALVAAAAQNAVSAVLDLAVLHGINVETEWQINGETIHVPKHARFVIGTDPFHDHAARTTWLRSFRLAEDRLVDLSIPQRVRDLSDACEEDWVSAIAKLELDTSSPPLLTEDEWESAVVRRFICSRPILHVDVHTVELQPEFLERCPPLYSWGFVFRDISRFRDAYPTTRLTRYWQLIDGFEGHSQLCKGGGCRDRASRTFLLGARGRMRAGEYDEFVR